MEVETTFTGFANRAEAGHKLAKALADYRSRRHAIVLALPRGGVVTGAAVAEDLDLPLDVLVVRKLGTPGQEELALGAIGPGGVRVLNDDVVAELRIPHDWIDTIAQREQLELDRREHLYRGDRPPVDVAGRVVILVDDGLATGSTMTAAVKVVQKQGAARIVLAVPVAPKSTVERLRFVVDELIYLETPEPFQAVGYWYVDFEQVSDGEVVSILERVRSRETAAAV